MGYLEMWEAYVHLMQEQRYEESIRFEQLVAVVE